MIDVLSSHRLLMFQMKISEDISCKEYLLLEEETQNNNTCQKLEEDARLPRTC